MSDIINNSEIDPPKPTTIYYVYTFTAGISVVLITNILFISLDFFEEKFPGY